MELIDTTVLLLFISCTLLGQSEPQNEYECSFRVGELTARSFPSVASKKGGGKAICWWLVRHDQTKGGRLTTPLTLQGQRTR